MQPSTTGHATHTTSSQAAQVQAACSRWQDPAFRDEHIPRMGASFC